RLLSLAPLWRLKNPQVLHRVSGDDAPGKELPQSILHFRRQPPAGGDELGEERGAAALQGFRDRTSGVRQVARKLICRSISGPRGAEQPLHLFAADERDVRIAPGHRRSSDLAARLERHLCGLGARSTSRAWRTSSFLSRQPSPGDLPIPTRPLEQLGKVGFHPRRKQDLLPGCRRSLVTLEERNRLRQPAFAAKRVPRSEVMPAKQEAHEILRRERLDLLSHPPDREPVNPLKQSAVAPFHLLVGR